MDADAHTTRSEEGGRGNGDKVLGAYERHELNENGKRLLTGQQQAHPDEEVLQHVQCGVLHTPNGIGRRNAYKRIDYILARRKSR